MPGFGQGLMSWTGSGCVHVYWEGGGYSDMEVTRECKLKDLFKRGLISDFAWLNFFDLHLLDCSFN